MGLRARHRIDRFQIGFVVVSQHDFSGRFQIARFKRLEGGVDVLTTESFADLLDRMAQCFFG